MFIDSKSKLLDLVLEEKPKTKPALEKLKRHFARQRGDCLISNSDLLREYRRQVKTGRLEKSAHLENLLRTKKTRTLSGVTPVAVFTKAYPCPGNCVYCPTFEDIPKSYLADEPAVMRAEMNEYDPVRQIWSRLQQYKNIGHPTDKIELIIKGATWSAYPPEYQKWFITRCFQTCNQETPPADLKFLKEKETTLRAEQQRNETGPHRVIGINVETRPDLIDPSEISRLRSFGVTKVEIGVQSIYDEVLELIERGHQVADTVRATRLLKEAGFKVGYHIMPNLPGSDRDKDLEMFKTLFNDARFQPDNLKIYPCVVLPNSQLHKWYQQGEFRPYSQEELVNLLVDIKQLLPAYVRVDRVGRDIPVGNIAAGYKKSNIRQIVQDTLRRQGQTCRCVRCREIRQKTEGTKPTKLRRLKYPASDGTEIFLEYIGGDEWHLLAMLRLRLNADRRAIVRELHTYGVSLPLQSDKKGIQHRGLGKKLLKQAEDTARTNGYRELIVIAGIGVREYYRKLNYELRETYMVKNLTEE